MLSNFWEEQMMADIVHNYHQAKMGKMTLPKWIMGILCPFCGAKLDLISIRTISLCLNTRNFGDLVVEIVCNACSRMDSLYFREDIKNIKDFTKLLMESKPKVDPIIEEEMYKNQYNNIVEKMVMEQGGKIRKIAFHPIKEKPNDAL